MAKKMNLEEMSASQDHHQSTGSNLSNNNSDRPMPGEFLIMKVKIELDLFFFEQSIQAILEIQSTMYHLTCPSMINTMAAMFVSRKLVNLF